VASLVQVLLPNLAEPVRDSSGVGPFTAVVALAGRATVGGMASRGTLAFFRRAARPAAITSAQARGALAIGALAVGAAAVGGFAIGRLTVGRLAIGKATIGRLAVGRLAIEELEIGKLTVREGLRDFPK
jgi:hypothetical protein